MKTISTLRVALITILSFGAAIASAPSFAGATVYKENADTGVFCDTDTTYGGAGDQICAQNQGRWMLISMPNGSKNYMYKGVAFISVSYSGFVTKTSVEVNEKMLFKIGEEQKGHSFITTNIVNSLNGQCTTYSIEYDTIFSNGDVVQKNNKVTSTPC